MSGFSAGFSSGFGPPLMATGRLGGLDLVGGVETSLYTPPALNRSSVKVTFVNRNAGVAARVRVVLRPGGGPTNGSDYLAFDEVVPVNESRVSAVFDIENPQELLVQSDVGSVTAQANGIERVV